MVTRTVRRAFSGLTSALTPVPKTNQRVEHALKSAQQHADEAWRRTMHGAHIVLHRKDPKS